METLFLALAVPEGLADALEPIWAHYGSVVDKRQSRERLHLTLVWLGEGRAVSDQLIRTLTQPLPQSFVPTVRLTHIGRGHVRNQLWAYGEAAGPIMGLRQQLIGRLQETRWQLPPQASSFPFTPHIKIASLYDQVSHIGIADYPLVTAFSVKAVRLYKSTREVSGQRVYSVIEQIALL